MAFINTKVTLASAVATNGTFTVAYPTNADLGLTSNGMFKDAQGHVMFAEGLQALYLFPKDFSISFAAANMTFTYLGLTTIPANTVLAIQLNTVGLKGLSPYSPRIPRTSDVGYLRVLLGAPVAASTTAVVNVAARAGTTINVYATPVVLDVPRNLQYVSSTTDTTQTITVVGTDEYGVKLTETVTLNGATPVLGKKAFKTVVSDINSLALAGNLSIGTGVKYGLPAVLYKTPFVTLELMDDAAPTAGSYVAADITLPSATTGDVRGTYTPNTAANGTHYYELVMLAPDGGYQGLAQF